MPRTPAVVLPGLTTMRCTRLERTLLLCAGVVCLMVAAGFLAGYVQCVDGQDGPEYSAVETLCRTAVAAADHKLAAGRGCVRINATIPDAAAAPRGQQGPYPVLRVYPAPAIDNGCTALGPAGEPEPRQRRWIQVTLAAYPPGSTFGCDVVDGRAVYRRVDRGVCTQVTALVVFLTILGIAVLFAVTGLDSHRRRASPPPLADAPAGTTPPPLYASPTPPPPLSPSPDSTTPMIEYGPDGRMSEPPPCYLEIADKGSQGTTAA